MVNVSRKLGNLAESLKGNFIHGFQIVSEVIQLA
jgi:hypothetical protein